MPVDLSRAPSSPATVESLSPTSREPLKTHYTWTFGLSVRDWRYVVRIANIPKSLVEHVAGECPTQGTESPSPSSSAQHPLCALLVQALNLIPSYEGIRLAFYGNRDVATAPNLLQAAPRNTCVSGKKTESRPAFSFSTASPSVALTR